MSAGTPTTTVVHCPSCGERISVGGTGDNVFVITGMSSPYPPSMLEAPVDRKKLRALKLRDERDKWRRR